MTIQITPAEEPTIEQKTDFSSLPPSAFPEGVDPNDYAAKMTAPEGEDAPAADTPATDKQIRPDHVPEKFWNAETGEVNVEGLLKSYKELEEHQFKKTEATPEQAPAEGAPAPLADVLAEFTTAFEANNGEVGEDVLAKVIAAGIPDYAIEAFKVGYQVLSNEPFDIAHKVAGGEDAFQSAMAWAERGLTTAEIAEFNEAASSRGTIGLAVESLMNKYRAAHPSEGSFVHATKGNGAADIFKSRAELNDAIKNTPNYRNPEVQEAILAKIERSKAAGTL